MNFDYPASTPAWAKSLFPNFEKKILTRFDEIREKISDFEDSVNQSINLATKQAETALKLLTRVKKLMNDLCGRLEHAYLPYTYTQQPPAVML